MFGVAFSLALPVERLKHSLPARAVSHRPALVCSASWKRQNPEKRRRSPLKASHGPKTSLDRRPRVDLGEAERLQKVMSRLGVASRRKSEELIAEGKVRVNGRIVKGQGTLVNSRKDRITVNGKELTLQDRAVWMAVHKPTGYLSLPRDGNRKSIMDLIPPKKRNGLITVGGIDDEHSGIVILTNERGQVPMQSSPQNRHVKEWRVDCEGAVSNAAVDALRRGVHLKGELSKCLAADVQIVGSERVQLALGVNKTLTRMEVRVRESRRRLIRRLFEHVGLQVFHASRKSFGPVHLGSLKRGDFRYLTPKEVKALTRGTNAAK